MLHSEKNTIAINDMDEMIKVFGTYDENIKIIKREYPEVKINSIDGKLEIEGKAEEISVVSDAINALLRLIRKKEKIDKIKVLYCLKLAKEGCSDEIDEIVNDVVITTAKGKQIHSKTFGQQKYVKAIKKNTIIFGVGPAGTGKTYLAVACAVNALRNKEIEKIILTRPAVEAGEKLGFLPGDLQDKVDPYLRPLYDALIDMMGAESFQRNFEKGIIEVAPLAYMRGRTLNNSFVILDEAQNTTSEQIKMFLTRLGEGSKLIINGDKTQVDLNTGKESGLAVATRILKDIEDIAIVKLTESDVVRHELVMRIVQAYEKAESNIEKGKKV